MTIIIQEQNQCICMVIVSKYQAVIWKTLHVIATPLIQIQEAETTAEIGL